MLMVLSLWTLTSGDVSAADVPAAVKNTQEETVPLPTAEEALRKWNLPEGFNVQLFASEPEIRQPIGMCWDARGRLWIAENDTYAESKTGYDLTQKDRILIFEDTDGDGRADKRTVFWDQGHHLTSVEVGFGGVWALCAPDLLFIPDRDGDDRPDGPPMAVLDGFDNASIRHNIVNGLKWGPDGRLYGRHGITTTSYVGVPGTPPEERTPINCGIWRYHPQSRKFEVVCHGTTNSWGHDWNEDGELFFINTVIGHLWHALPGSHLERMFGEDFGKHLYRLMPQTADHFHWDTKERWSDIRQTGVTPTTDSAGGGHAHCGMMIYLGDNWPATYRGGVFTLNLHGRRINHDALERFAAGYVGRHRPDFARTDDPWFRGIELSYGPDGCVYILDWSDIGECHENDGIHRTSGRVYRVAHGTPSATPPRDLAKVSDAELIGLLKHDNEWYPRTARRLLQERAVAGTLAASTQDELLASVQSRSSKRDRLRALWSLYSIGGASVELLGSLLDDNEEAVRAQAVALLADQPIEQAELIQLLVRRAERETSGLVLLRLASALQRLPMEERFGLAGLLSGQATFADDRQLPLMVWYGIEPAVPLFPDKALKLSRGSRLPLVRQYVARRLTSEIGSDSGPAALLLEEIAQVDSAAQLDLLRGMSEALEGRRKQRPPEGWKTFAAKMETSGQSEAAEITQRLSVIFGDGQALDAVRKIAMDGNQKLETRRQAIESLVSARDGEAVAILQKLINERDLAADAIRGLAAFKHPQTAELIVGVYGRLYKHVRAEAIETLASRPEFAHVLLDAVSARKIDQGDVTPFYVRQMKVFPDEGLQAKLQRLWPEWRHTSEEKLSEIEKRKSRLTAEVITAGDLERGREVFQKSCASCHVLFGTGGKIGPDLTGSQRKNLQYLLENIIDPSAQIAEKYRMSIIALSDGRVLSGVVIEESDDLVVVQTPKDQVRVLTSDIEERRQTNLSMMPERLLDEMNETQVSDLFRYLMN